MRTGGPSQMGRGAFSVDPKVNKLPLPAQQPQQQPQRPMSMGQGENYFPDIHNMNVRAQMANRGAPNGAPPSLQNAGRYGGFESNYFPDARMNMPPQMPQQAPQGFQPQGAGYQGFPGNYFPDAQQVNRAMSPMRPQQAPQQMMHPIGQIRR